MDRGAWKATVHRVAEETAEGLSLHLNASQPPQKNAVYIPVSFFVKTLY